MIDFKLASLFLLPAADAEGILSLKRFLEFMWLSFIQSPLKRKVLVLFTFIRLHVFSILVVFVHSGDETDFFPQTAFRLVVL